MTNNVTAKDASNTTVAFTTDHWAADPSGASDIPGTKLIFGERNASYTFVDDVAGKRLPVKIGDALPTGSNVIGGVTQSGGPWSVSVAGAVAVSGTFFPATQPISGAVSVSNLPASQPVTVVDGGNATQGAIADAAVVSDVVGTLSAKLRGLVKILASVWDSVNGRLKVDGSGVTQPVSGTVSISGGVAIVGAVTIVDSVALAVSATSLPLPTGAALETGGNLATLAGAVSAGKVTIAGTVTASAGTNLNTAALALEVGGNLAAIATNTTGAAKDTSLATIDADLKSALPRLLYDGAGLAVPLGQALMRASLPVTIAQDQLDFMLRYRRQMDEIRNASLRDSATIAALVTRFCARTPLADNRGRYDRGYR